MQNISRLTISWWTEYISIWSMKWTYVMECRAHNHELNKNKCVLSFQVISILSVKIPSHLGYSRMSHSIYFQAFLESRLGRLNIPEGDLATRECMQSQPLPNRAPCGFSPMSLLQSTNACLTFSPWVQKNLKTELAALHFLTVMFQMFYLAFMHHGHSCLLNFPSLIKYLQSRCNRRAKVSE